MAEKTSKSAIMESMRKEGMERINLADAVQIGGSEWAVPVVGGYVSIQVTAKNPMGTDKVPAFDLDAAVEKYRAKVADREKKAAEKAAEKAAKLAKAASKTSAKE